jgi:hypothetical protein
MAAACTHDDERERHERETDDAHHGRPLPASKAER